jgi:predicted metalloprotease with PDZ domain
MSLMATFMAAQVEPVSYTLRFPEPHTHYVEVEASIPSAGSEPVELFMAVWTPGSYLVREYARNVEQVTASAGGKPVGIRKVRKNRWRADAPGPLTVKYRVYCREMSVRTNWVEAGFAMLNVAPTFLYPVGDLKRPARVTVVPAAGWSKVVSPLGEGNTVTAADYDTLVDSPLYAGNAATYEFEVAGKKHLLVNEGEGGMWDGPRSAADVRKIVEQQVKMWGIAPYPRYVFFNMLTESGGGLEHKDSTVLMASRFATKLKSTYSGGIEEGDFRGGWLGLVSHEFFHLWNVKRLRPVELGPFDYENENYVRSLWEAEGFTSYYTELLVARAGFINPDEYLAAISSDIQTLQSAAGRTVQSAELSSFDAWIKQYRPDENSRNTSISYYTKGGVIGFLLDARIREATGGAKSLDDLMRLLYQRHSGPRGFSRAEFDQAAATVSGQDQSTWLTRALETTEELDYREAMDWYGLRWREAPAEKRASLGADLRAAEGRLTVSRVSRDGAAHRAGLNVDDEILALDGYRVTQESLRRRLRFYAQGARAQLLVARRDQILTLTVTLGEEPGRYRLEADRNASADQKLNLAALLRPY